MSTNVERGPLWPFVLVAEDDDGQLVWCWRGPLCNGEWKDSRAAALADLYEYPGTPVHVRDAALEEYNKIAARAFRAATSTLRGPGWDL